MKKEEPSKKYSYLKKELLKTFFVSGFLIFIMIVLLILDNRFGFVIKITEKMMEKLIK